MKIAIGCDHGGFVLKQPIIDLLKQMNHEIVDCGTQSADSVDYPEFAKKVAILVQKKQVDYGIVMCGTGIGVSIVANKFKGIRAALCHNLLTAEMARAHNDANVLALGGRVISPTLAQQIVEKFLTTAFEGGRHLRRVEEIDKSKPPPNLPLSGEA
jgi:ribose 5-phosphate isomerase B